ncbi:MAG: hypothetical protein SFU53_13020 [Terrimicrobiaceae bacterium]|nr:hypothetical protein [Terrimicrobiaceae bacterium]
MSRAKILAGAAILIVLAAIWRFWPDGTISVDFTNAPLSKVIASIERQGRVDIVTNAPPETPVTLQMKRAPLLEVMETLAVRIEAEFRPALIAAPTAPGVKEAVARFEQSARPQELTVAGAWGGGGMFAPETVIDARALEVAFEPVEKNTVQSALQQISIKSGLLTAVPADWNPDLAKFPKSGAAVTLAREVATSAGGKSSEIFLLLARGGGRPDGEDRGPRTADGGPGSPGGGGGPGGWGGGGRPNVNPAWMEARAQAMIAQLPPEERARAQSDFDEIRTFMRSIADLPPEERRAKAEEFFSRPEIQERMMERQEARDARRTPEQREQRMKRYVERKKEMKAAQAQ